RAAYYPRLLGHLQFWNWLLLFPDVKANRPFSINVFAGAPRPAVGFSCIFNLCDPGTVARCREHDGAGEAVPRLKTEDGTRDARGPGGRPVTVTERERATSAGLLDGPGTPAAGAKLPQVHSREVLSVLHRFAEAPARLRDLPNVYKATEMIHERHGQRKGHIT